MVINSYNGAEIVLLIILILTVGSLSKGSVFFCFCGVEEKKRVGRVFCAYPGPSQIGTWPFFLFLFRVYLN